MRGTSFKKQWRDFPSGPLVKISPSKAGSASSIPGRGTKILQTLWSKKKKKKVKQKQCYNKLSKDVKNGPHHIDRKSSGEAVIRVI